MYMHIYLLKIAVTVHFDFSACLLQKYNFKTVQVNVKNIKQKYFDQVAYRPFISLAQRTVDMSKLQCGKQTFSLTCHRNIFYFGSKKHQ